MFFIVKYGQNINFHFIINTEYDKKRTFTVKKQKILTKKEILFLFIYKNNINQTFS